jgi:CRP/FNR family transcriptional regulator, cyclic AMP receptor protein
MAESSSPVFSAIADPSIRALAARGLVRNYRKNTVIIEEGTVGDTLYVILSGRVKVYTSHEDDREFIFDFYGPGEYIGEMALDGGPRSASVMAMEATSCAVVSRDQLTAHIAAEPEFALQLLARVIRRARFATANAKNLALLDVYGRVVRLLTSLAAPNATGGAEISERLTHQEIADRVGSSREMVSRILKDLVAGGYIQIEAKAITLRRPLPSAW